MNKKIVFLGSAVHVASGESAELSVYHLGGLRYELHRSGWIPYGWTAPEPIDRATVGQVFERVYNLKHVSLSPILLQGSEGQRRQSRRV